MYDFSNNLRAVSSNAGICHGEPQAHEFGGLDMSILIARVYRYASRERQVLLLTLTKRYDCAMNAVGWHPPPQGTARCNTQT